MKKFIFIIIVLGALLLLNSQAFAQTFSQNATPNVAQNLPTQLEIFKTPSWGLRSIDFERARQLPKRSPATEAPDANDVKDAPVQIVVAVIDTGIDASHPDLRDHLWINEGESGRDHFGRDKAHNQIDDDENGYIDDVHGWNFVDGGPEPKDKHGHGTHIAGIIAMVAPDAVIMPLKYYDPKADAVTGISHTIHAIEYAIKMKVNIINYSAGGPSANWRERRMLERARSQGILVIAAAGNEGENSDRHRYYPADYDLSNIMSVAAIDADRRLLPTSNYGATTVTIAAPGEAILSTLPGGGYGPMTGTSQATAFASGVAALFLSRDGRGADPERVIRHLTQTGTRSDSLAGKTRARTCLNAYRSLAIRDFGEDAGGNFARNAAGIDPRFFSLDQE